MLEVPPGTVKSRCARGRSRLAQRLAHLAPGNPTPNPPVQQGAPTDEEGT
jgi:RNA polymerase sigma-70 factor, ECF subfamily